MNEFRVALICLIVIPVFQNCSEVRFEEPTLPSRVCVDVQAEEMVPQLKWSWLDQLDLAHPDAFPEFTQVMSTPMVGDLNGDRVPEVVFTTFSGRSYTGKGVLRIVSGTTGETKRSIGDDELAPYGSTSPLLIDIDRNGTVEIFYVHYKKSTLVSLNSDGSKRWIYTLPVNIHNDKGLSAADLDGDGKAEVIVGKYVLSENSSGSPVIKVELQGSEPAGWQFAASLLPSLPNEMQIVGRSGIYSPKGQQLFPMHELSYAAANIDGRPGLELVGAGGGGLLKIYDAATGSLQQDIDLSIYNELKCDKGIGGGPPTLGDFDGDPSSVEIAMATGRYLIVMDSSGKLRAKYETQDCSSLKTGISSFDFNGDGKPEILYGDEEYFRIFELNNEELRLVWSTVNPSGTLSEYPVVADIDGNGSSELLVAANNYAAHGFYKDAGEEEDKKVAATVTGIRAFSSAKAFAWMPTRPTWHQFDYNPAFVTEDLMAVLKTPVENTFTSRLFRRNAQLGEFESTCQ